MRVSIAGALIYLLVMFNVGFHLRNERFDQTQHTSSPETMTAGSIRRLAKCLNDGDGLLRGRYEQYKAVYNKTPVPSVFHFSGFAMTAQGTNRYGGAYKVISPCDSSIVVEARGLDVSGALSRTATEYLSTFNELNPPASSIDVWYADNAQVDPVKARQLDAELTPVAEKLFRLSDTLRHDLDVIELPLRARQLDLIAAQQGQNQDWHTLNVMLRARETVLRLTQAAAGQQLTPALVNQQRESLQKALTQMADYLRLHPRSDLTDDTIWANIAKNAQSYQKALDQLHVDWHPGATPASLSADFFAVTNGYDELLTAYNREARDR